MNALDAYDDNPDEALRPSKVPRNWVDSLAVGDEVIYRFRTSTRGIVRDVAPSPHYGQTQYLIQRKNDQTWMTADRLRVSYRPGRLYMGPVAKPHMEMTV